MAGRGGQTSGQPTLDQVAARAGVGRGTVSRVINGSPQVSPEARAAVHRAIADLGYVPNRAARALVTRRTDVVALVLGAAPLPGEFFERLVRGVGARLADDGLQLWLVAPRPPEELAGQLTAQHVDGVLLLTPDDDASFTDGLGDRGVPVVAGGLDDRGAGRIAVQHLIDGGRRRIVAIAARPGPVGGWGDVAARLAGYREGLGDAWDEELTGYAEPDPPGGAAALAALLARHPRLDAVFATSEPLAVGALRALRDSGRRVPADVAVVAVDDAGAGPYTEPPLTVVRHPAGELGREMADRLVAMIQGGVPAPEPTAAPNLAAARLPPIVLGARLLRRASA